MRWSDIAVATALAALGASAASPAHAEFWDTSAPSSEPDTGWRSSLNFSEGNSPYNASLQLVAQGYFVNDPATLTVANIESAQIKAATVQQFGGGIGLNSTTTADPNTNSPNHTLDNQGGYEFMVFKLPDVGATTDWKLTSFQANTYAGGLSGRGDNDVTVLIGGNNLTDLSGLTSTSSSGNANSIAELKTNYGFTDITSLITKNPSAEPTSCPSDPCNGATPITYTVNNAATPNTGKYVIIAAAITTYDRDDDMKIASISTARVTHSTAVPEPGTLALVTTGIAGVWWRRRRLARA